MTYRYRSAWVIFTVLFSSLFLACNESVTVPSETQGKNYSEQAIAAAVSVLPVIVVQPVSIYGGTVGDKISFNVSVTGQAPFTYEWRRNGVRFLNSNSATFSKIVHLEDSGAAFTCKVSNAYGSVVSDPAIAYITRWVFQAEDGQLSGPVVSRVADGYTGSGYADYGTILGRSVQWNITITNPTTHTLVLRYANGSNTTVVGDLEINGKRLKVLSMTPTGGWNQWKNVGLDINFSAGLKVTRFTVNSTVGLNLDRLELR